MSDFEDKHRTGAFRAALFVGLWWGFVETILLVWDARPAYFTWGRYLVAWAIITSCSVVITFLIAVPVSRLLGRRGRAEGAWATALLVPVTTMVGMKIALKVIPPQPRWIPNFYDLWYLPFILIVWSVVMFLLLRYLIQIFKRFHGGAIPLIITGLFVAALVVVPVIRNPSYLRGHSFRKNLPDVILITIDTVRTDHMASYGYFRQTTPFLDKLARESVVFDNTAVQIQYTLGSHTSMLTSRYASEIGISQVGASLDSRYPTLAKELKKNGYLTAAFISSFVLNRIFTKSLGFNVYDDAFSLYSWAGSSNVLTLLELSPISSLIHSLYHFELSDSQRRADNTTQTVIQWVKNCPENKPLFLWVHYFDPHFPLDPPAPFNQRFHTTPTLRAFTERRIDLKVLKNNFKIPPESVYEQNNLYDGELAFMDYWIEQLFKDIRQQRNRWDQSYVIVIADHGISLGENLYIGKLDQLYDTIIRVPFFIRLPDGNSQRIHAQVEAIDIMPTVLDLLGLKGPPEMRGRSLVPLIRGEEVQPRPAFSETLARPVKYSIRTPKFKLIYRTSASIPFQLFNLEEDPLEKENLALRENYLKRPEIKKLMSQLNRWIRKYHKGRKVKMAPLTPSTVEKLRDLGYIR